MFKKLVWATIVACLSMLADRSRAIEPMDGIAIKTAFPGMDVALHYLVAPNVGIVGSGINVVDDGISYSVSAPSLVQGDPDGDFYSSGTFTNGLAGGLVSPVWPIPLEAPIQTVGGIGIDKGVCLSTGRVQNRGPNQHGGYGVNGLNDAYPEGNPYNQHPGTASVFY